MDIVGLGDQLCPAVAGFADLKTGAVEAEIIAVVVVSAGALLGGAEDDAAVVAVGGDLHIRLIDVVVPALVARGQLDIGGGAQRNLAARKGDVRVRGHLGPGSSRSLGILKVLAEQFLGHCVGLAAEDDQIVLFNVAHSHVVNLESLVVGTDADGALREQGGVAHILQVVIQVNRELVAEYHDLQVVFLAGHDLLRDDLDVVPAAVCITDHDARFAARQADAGEESMICVGIIADLGGAEHEAAVVVVNHVDRELRFHNVVGPGQRVVRFAARAEHTGRGRLHGFLFHVLLRLGFRLAIGQCQSRHWGQNRFVLRRGLVGNRCRLLHRCGFLCGFFLIGCQQGLVLSLRLSAVQGEGGLYFGTLTEHDAVVDKLNLAFGVVFGPFALDLRLSAESLVHRVGRIGIGMDLDHFVLFKIDEVLLLHRAHRQAVGGERLVVGAQADGAVAELVVAEGCHQLVVQIHREPVAENDNLQGVLLAGLDIGFQRLDVVPAAVGVADHQAGALVGRAVDVADIQITDAREIAVELIGIVADVGGTEHDAAAVVVHCIDRQRGFHNIVNPVQGVLVTLGIFRQQDRLHFGAFAELDVGGVAVLHKLDLAFGVELRPVAVHVVEGGEARIGGVRNTRVGLQPAF